MTVKDLYSAMSGIEDRYLAMADAPNKEDISMKKHSGKLRFFLIAAALVSLLGVTAYAVTAKIQLNTKRYMQGNRQPIPMRACKRIALLGFRRAIVCVLSVTRPMDTRRCTLRRHRMKAPSCWRRPGETMPPTWCLKVLQRKKASPWGAFPEHCIPAPAVSGCCSGRMRTGALGSCC